MSSEACPRTLRYICACLQRDVQNRCRNVVGLSLDFFFYPGGPKRDLWKPELSLALYSFAFSVLPYSIPDRCENWLFFHDHCLFNIRANKLGSTAMRLLLFSLFLSSLSLFWSLGFSRSLFLHQPCARLWWSPSASRWNTVHLFWSNIHHWTVLEPCKSGRIWRKGTLYGGATINQSLFSAFYVFKQRTLLWNWSWYIIQVVNPFILKNKERMVVFLDHLSSVREKPYPDEDRVKGDPARCGSFHFQKTKNFRVFLLQGSGYYTPHLWGTPWGVEWHQQREHGADQDPCHGHWNAIKAQAEVHR